jgi:hypothetical protein
MTCSAVNWSVEETHGGYCSRGFQYGALLQTDRQQKFLILCNDIFRLEGNRED